MTVYSISSYALLQSLFSPVHYLYFPSIIATQRNQQYYTTVLDNLSIVLDNLSTVLNNLSIILDNLSITASLIDFNYPTQIITALVENGGL